MQEKKKKENMGSSENIVGCTLNVCKLIFYGGMLRMWENLEIGAVFLELLNVKFDCTMVYTCVLCISCKFKMLNNDINMHL